MYALLAPCMPVVSQTNQGYVKSVKMGDNGIMQQGQHRSFVLRAESTAERDTWVEALRAEVPAFHMELSTSRSLSATPATSSAPTPIGTPSESGRRSGKFGASTRDRRRRATVDVDAASQMPHPVIRGWARTQSDQHEVSVLCCCTSSRWMNKCKEWIGASSGQIARRLVRSPAAYSMSTERLD